MARHSPRRVWMRQFRRKSDRKKNAAEVGTYGCPLKCSNLIEYKVSPVSSTQIFGHWLNEWTDCRHQRCDRIEKTFNISKYGDNLFDMLNTALDLIVDGLQFLGSVLDLLGSLFNRCFGQLDLVVI